MVGSVDKTSYALKTLKFYILRDREKQRQEDEAKAKKTRKKNEEDKVKLKVETEFKATYDKITELTKKYERLKCEKVRVFEYLMKVLTESKKYSLEGGDLAKLYEMGLVIPTAANHQPDRVSNLAPSSIITKIPVSQCSQYKSPTMSILPVQALSTSKRNRSPSPVYRRPYVFKKKAVQLPFQKLEDPHRNREYNRSYSYTEPGNILPSSNYDVFYPSNQNITFSHSSQFTNDGAAINSSYANFDNVDSLHRSQSSIDQAPLSSRHSSLYAHRLPESYRQPPSIQSNHVCHPKDRVFHPDEKYYIQPGRHIPVHDGVFSIQHKSLAPKYGSITSSPVGSVEARMNPDQQITRPSHGDHHSSHSWLSSHQASQSHELHHPPDGVYYPSPYSSPTRSSSQSLN